VNDILAPEETGDYRMTDGKHPFRAEFFLFSLLLFFVVAPFLEEYAAGELVLVIAMFMILISATMQLTARRVLFRTSIGLAGLSMALLVTSRFYRPTLLVIVDHVTLTLFLGVVFVGLFSYMGREGSPKSSRLYICVSLYFLLGMCWFSLFNTINTLQPGSFASHGIGLTGRLYPSTLLYFSLATLTTVGYGDIVPVTPVARMFATLEAASGVLYIAITVARLVSAKEGGGE
jgi:hypothetical protein